MNLLKITWKGQAPADISVKSKAGVGSMEDKIKISKFISFALRHHPEKAGIVLDAHGYADTNSLIESVKKRFRDFNMKYLEKIVAEDNKQRYSFNEDKTKIRANQGHSVQNVDIGFEEKIPPEILFHGTAERFMNSINEQGILKMTRQYVHLSGDKNTAYNVGKRHGEPVVILIDSEKMQADGYKFFLSENGVWLTDHVPTEYFIAAVRLTPPDKIRHYKDGEEGPIMFADVDIYEKK